MASPVPIADQVAEVEREIRQRERLYQSWLAEADAGGRRRITPETAERKLRDLRAAAATLRFIAEHAKGLRALAHFLRSSADVDNPTPPTTDERAALLGHPAVQTLLEAWPEAEVTGIAPLRVQTDLFEGATQ